jgi:lysophospholipase L1-like esterase
MRPRRRFFTKLSVCAAAALALSQGPLALQAQSRFEAEIQRMLERDTTNPPPQRGILFIGSSIFRLWSGLSEQMAPLPVFNRAFGGSRTQDMIDQFDRLVAPYQPRIIVYYCGSNDVNAGADASSILENTKRFLGLVSQKLPTTAVYYTAIQKAPDKRARWDVVDAVNREMERYASQTKGVGFIDLNPVLFRDGALREDLFLPDQLHFRPESSAYAEFAEVVKPVLAKAWESIQ